MWGAYVKGLHQTGGVGGDSRGMSDHPVCKWLLMICVQHQIIGDGIGLDHAVFMAIFRNVGHAARCQLPWRCLGDICPLEDDAASHRMPEPRQRFDQLRLAIALDPAIPRISPACTASDTPATAGFPRSSRTSRSHTRGLPRQRSHAVVAPCAWARHRQPSTRQAGIPWSRLAQGAHDPTMA